MISRLQNLLRNNAKRGTFKAEKNVIYLYDMIVSSEIEAEWYGGVTPMQIAIALAGMTGDVSLRINSPGGDVFAGVAMSQMLREYEGKVTAHVDGYAASAASIVACSADECVMAPGSMMMIHKAWTISLGNAEEMRSTADLLDKIDMQIAQGYATKSGKDVSGFIAAMSAETWFSDQEAVEAGLADRVSENEKKAKTGADAEAVAKAEWNLMAFLKGPAKVAPPPDPAPDPINESEKRMRNHAVRMLETTA